MTHPNSLFCLINRSPSPITTGKTKSTEVRRDSKGTSHSRETRYGSCYLFLDVYFLDTSIFLYQESVLIRTISIFRAKSHETGIVWLEKELQKLQREKIKLEREKAKYVDREHRLEKIKTAMGKQEITVKTSKGEEFKFGGISENFTRKLYEWEERRNIAPESSTIALLNSNLSQSPKSNTGSKDQNSNIEGES